MDEIKELKQQLEALASEVHNNNFSSSQDFVKFSRFNTRVKLPTLSAAPTSCEIGEVYINSGDGKLYVCSASNTWQPQT